MQVDDNPKGSPPQSAAGGKAGPILALIGVFGPIATFAIAVSGLPYDYKIAALSAIAVASSAICLWSYWSLNRELSSARDGRHLQGVRELTGAVDIDESDHTTDADTALPDSVSDPLTGLANERAFFLVLDHQLAECRRSGEDRPLSVLAIEAEAIAAGLDEIVDRSRVLRAFGYKLSKFLRQMDFAARFNDDRIYVILPKVNEAAAIEIAERIGVEFANGSDHEEVDGLDISVTAGWSTFDRDGETGDELVRQASRRLDELKAERVVRNSGMAKDYVH